MTTTTTIFRKFKTFSKRMEDAEDERIGDDVYQQLRFDLCPECRRKFLKNPLAREMPAKAFGFSSN